MKIKADAPQCGIFFSTLFNIFTSDQPTTLNTMIADSAVDRTIITIHDYLLTASSNLQTLYVSYSLACCVYFKKILNKFKMF